MPQFIDSIEYTDTKRNKVTLDSITSVSTVDASTLSVANIIPSNNGAVNPLGRNTDNEVGSFSTALGYRVTASETGSTALGSFAEASAASSTALGDGAKASADYSIALGDGAEASADSSIALGERPSASGIYSIALGLTAKASADSSIALGRQAAASKMYSTALGHVSNALALYSTALGWDATVPEVEASTMQLGSNTDLSALHCIQPLTKPSDKRDKTDIEGITDALAFLERLNPVTFVNNNRVEYISDEDKKGENYRTYGMCEYDRVSHAAGTKKGERRRCGLIAQEVVEAMQSVYGTDNYADIVNDNFHDLAKKPSDVENKYTLAYSNLVPFLIGAVKELNAKIKALESKLATLSDAGVQED